MKVTGIEAIPVSVPRNPDINIVGRGGTTIPNADFVIVIVHTDDGIDGLGEAPVEVPWTGEDSVIAKHCIDRYLAPVVIGQNPLDLNLILDRMTRAIPWHPYAKAAVEMACWDIAGKAVNQPLYSLLGGKVRDRCGIKLVCSGPDAVATARMAEGAVARGFTTVKLKTGFATGIASDVERVAAVRAAVGPDIRIVIDSNAGWTVPDAIRALRMMEPYDLLFAEQPVAQQDPRWMAEVRRHSVAPIAAHESMFTLWDATRAVEHGVADIWAITPSTHGGLIPARKILAIAEANGIGCLIGSTLELGISTASLLHLAVSAQVLDGGRYPSDIIGPLYHPSDIIEETFEVRGGEIAPPEGPGLGVTLSKAALEQFRVDR